MCPAPATKDRECQSAASERAARANTTEAGAKALRLEGYGLQVGAKADFVTLQAEHVPEAVVGVPQGRSVYKGSRLVASSGRIMGKRG